MLKDEDRFFAYSGNIYPGGPSTWHVTNWDQRRLVSVTMDEELDSEDRALDHLAKHIDELAPDVFEIRLSPHGDLISVSTDREDDNMFCPFYPPLEVVERPEGIQVISRSELEELDRLGPLVDLVRCVRSAEPSERVSIAVRRLSCAGLDLTRAQLVFKYYFLSQRLSYVWHEMNLWMRLPKHPHIVPFDKIVVDELEGRFIGFTTVYIPGGTFQENQNRTFKLKWLLQLISVVDELNLNLGISHQDIAPRNLLVEEQTDSLQVFDFNFSVRIGEPGYSKSRNDVDGVIFTMYEIISRDDTHRAVPHEEQNIAEIEGKDWTQHPGVQLDSPVSGFRQVLTEWSTRRRAATQMATYKEAPNFIDWPDTPQPPPTEFVFQSTAGPITQLKVVWSWERKRMLEQGKPVLEWQRPPQSQLKPGDKLLETGELMMTTT